MNAEQVKRRYSKLKNTPNQTKKNENQETAESLTKSDQKRRSSFFVTPMDIKSNQDSKDIITPRKQRRPNRIATEMNFCTHKFRQVASMPKLTINPFNLGSGYKAQRYQAILEQINRQQSSQKIKPFKPYLKRPVSRESLCKAKRYTSRNFTITSLPKMVYQISAIKENGSVNSVPKAENTNEFLVFNDFAGIKNQTLIAVFDGIGKHGVHLSKAMRQRLPNHIKDNLSGSLQFSTGLPVKADEALYLRQALLLGYKHTIYDLRKEYPDYMENSGTTWTILIIRGNLVITVHVGDSVALLADKNYNWSANTLTAPHILQVQQERARIEEKGGIISGDPALIYIQDKKPPSPALRVTRLVGNLTAHEIGISYKPGVNEVYFTSSSKLIIIATNGFWSVVNEDEVLRIAAKYWRMGSSNGLVSKLLEYAQEEWKISGENNIDDMTIIALFLDA